MLYGTLERSESANVVAMIVAPKARDLHIVSYSNQNLALADGFLDVIDNFLENNL